MKLVAGFKDTTMNNANILGAKHLKPREVEDDSVAGDLRYKLQLINRKEQHEDRKRQNKIFAGNEVEKNVNEDQSLKSGAKHVLDFKLYNNIVILHSTT